MKSTGGVNRLASPLPKNTMTMNKPTGETMDEGSEMPTEHEGMMDEESDTANIPSSLVEGSPQPGEVISLTVVSVDEQNGTLTVTKAGQSQSEPKGSENLAAEFEQAPPTQS